MIITPEQITNQRKQLNLSQKQLSELTGIPQGNISRIEKGSYNPTEETLRKIAEALVRLDKEANKPNQNQFDDQILNINNITHPPQTVEELIKLNEEQTGVTYEEAEEKTHRILAFLEEYIKLNEAQEAKNFVSETKED